MANLIICRQKTVRLLLIAGLTLAIVGLLPFQALAVELNGNVSALSLAGTLLCEAPVKQDVEIYGLRQMAEAVGKYRRGKVGNRKGRADTSFIIAGEVSNPGEYDLRSPVNLLAAVLSAGGISENGSMRCIEVYHAGSLLGEFDLYSFFADGRIANDFVFNGGEQIVVLPHGPRISITGSVFNPGVFELKSEEMRLDRALEFAGGLPEEDKVYRIEVVRIDESRLEATYSFDYRLGDAILPYQLLPGDQIHVLKCEEMLQRKIYAQLPGDSRQEFGYRLNMRISDLLNILRPLPANVALSYAEILREGRPDKKYEVISISIDALRRQIVAEDFSNDLILRPGDFLILFDREFLEDKPVVGLDIEGQPMIFVDFQPGMTVSDLLESGSFRSSRRRSHATVFRRQLKGSQLAVVSLVIDVDAAKRKNQRHNIKLQPFDTLQIQP